MNFSLISNVMGSCDELASILATASSTSSWIAEDSEMGFVDDICSLPGENVVPVEVAFLSDITGLLVEKIVVRIK
jgi:hypothetical protein